MKLCEVHDRVTQDDAGKWDLVIERDEMRFQDGRLRFPRLYRADHPQGLALTKWATAQFCQRLSIPTAYFRRCPRHLQDEQANFWLHRPEEEAVETGKKQTRPDRWLLRAKGDALRGILSERYAKMNNADVLATLEPLLEGRYEVGWFAVTEESLHLRLVDPKLAREMLPGDRVIAGLHIANSEVGKRSVTVDALVWRLVCSNGLVRLVKGRSLLHQRHVSLTQPRFEVALRNAVREAMIQGTGFMERMLQATAEPIPEVEATLTTISAQWGLSQTLQEQVKGALLTEPRGQQETLYGLVNAFTNVAQGLPPDDRYTLEALAGRLLERGAPRNGHAVSLPGMAPLMNPREGEETNLALLFDAEPALAGR